MSLLKNSWENRYVQAILRGMKPSIIGIVLGIGFYMVFKNCNIVMNSIGINYRLLIMTFVLLVIYYGSRKFLKKKLTPIHLIVISAVTGIIASYIQ